MLITSVSSEAQVNSSLLSNHAGNCFFRPKEGQCGSCGAISNTENVFFLQKCFLLTHEPKSRWVSQKPKICILSPMAIKSLSIKT